MRRQLVLRARLAYVVIMRRLVGRMTDTAKDRAATGPAVLSVLAKEEGAIRAALWANR